MSQSNDASSTREVDDDEEPIIRSPEGILLYQRGESVLISSEVLQDTPGPDGVLSSAKEFQNIAVDLPEAIEEADNAG